VSTGALFRDFSRNSLSFFKDINLTDQALVHVFFNDLISTHYRKDMYQNWLGVLAAFGGGRRCFVVVLCMSIVIHCLLHL
jgi:amiloride-sensitive sodium channel